MGQQRARPAWLTIYEQLNSSEAGARRPVEETKDSKVDQSKVELEPRVASTPRRPRPHTDPQFPEWYARLRKDLLREQTHSMDMFLGRNLRANAHTDASEFTDQLIDRASNSGAGPTSPRRILKSRPHELESNQDYKMDLNSDAGAADIDLQSHTLPMPLTTPTKTRFGSDLNERTGNSVINANADYACDSNSVRSQKSTAVGDLTKPRRSRRQVLLSLGLPIGIWLVAFVVTWHQMLRLISWLTRIELWYRGLVDTPPLP